MGILFLLMGRMETFCGNSIFFQLVTLLREDSLQSSLSASATLTEGGGVGLPLPLLFPFYSEVCIVQRT